MGLKLLALLIAGALAAAGFGACAASEFSEPWKDADTAIVLDPYHKNSIDWEALAGDKKVAAIIHKASQGLKRDREYATRKAEAMARGYLWGSYHLFTTADATAQMDHYLSVVGTHPDETYALDVECLSTTTGCSRASFKVGIDDIRTALAHFREKTGRFPLLYANHSVTKVLAREFADEPEFADLKLWYARFKSTVTDFPSGLWSTYALWQFSSEINCAEAPERCPYRVPGVAPDMDVNIYFGSVEALRAAWPIN